MEQQPPPELLHQLARIADALERLANGGEPSAPDYVRPLEEFTAFDWNSINATVVARDASGPTHIEWGGQVYIRRSPQNKYDDAIWFSRPAGKDAEGNTRYLRLITFKEIKDAEPLPGRLVQAIQKPANGAQPPKTTQPTPPAPQPAPAPRPMPQNEYLALANQLNIIASAAMLIAHNCGVTETAASDYTPAVPHLTYYSQAKAAGLAFNNATELLKRSHNDPQKAIASLVKVA